MLGFPQVRVVEGGGAGEGKARWQGVRELPRAPCRGAATVRWEHRRVLEGLRNGDVGGRVPFWDSRIRRLGRLTGGVARRLRSGCVSEARMTAKGVL